ncbi:hypothetical protein EV188_102494 [Actinomycetospora succinea]|uniref:Replication protein n=1 Tax=Actinomycetospora succinea TaxID=663603 RepID=A0A4R6VHN1_9PSEU|nr:hypothetical protein [Actinomycetospora succinea]TDQ62838.1 hypothetical protein EV188_102494 [Actinomycetospora succinea]
MAKAQHRRETRWARRSQLRPITSLRRVRNCGTPLDPDGGVTLALTTGEDGTRSAGYSGLASCGSVWACPQCAAKIATRRAGELSRVMRAVDEAGGSAFLLTLTMRHARGDRLGLTKLERTRLRHLEENRSRYEAANANHWDFDEREAEAEAIEEHSLRQRKGCWDVLSDAWARVTSGGAWQSDQELFGGLLGWARVVEVTDGDNGWHVHIHALLCFGAQVSAELVAGSIGARMFSRWRGTLERKGFDASEQHGWDLRRVQLGDGDLADYFTKIAHEVTGSHRKEGRRAGGRTPMRLLADAVDTYEESAVARWWEWEQASEGRRQLTWSTGRRNLRALAQLGAEATDEDIAAEDLDADTRLRLPADTWDTVHRAGGEAELLNLAEVGGLEAVRAWLHARGLRWLPDVERPTVKQAHE